MWSIFMKANVQRWIHTLFAYRKEIAFTHVYSSQVIKPVDAYRFPPPQTDVRSPFTC